MNIRYLLGFLGAVGLIVVVFILVIRGLSGGDDRSTETTLTDYTRTQTVMRMTIQGEVNADQDHRSVTVTVGRTNNTIELNQGYQDRVMQTRNYASNEEAYGTFLRALQLQGYTRGDTNPDKEDYRGVCPTGSTYIFEIVTGSAVVQKFWTTSCDGGTFGGNATLIRELFRKQIPDYSDIVGGQGLS
jgi:hypothetical protein